MTQENFPVAIIEFYSSHDECLYSQLAILKSQNYAVHLLVNEQLTQRTSHFPADYKLSLSRNWRQIWQARRYIKQNEIKKVVFNTCSGNSVRAMVLLLVGTGVDLIGILHNSKKLDKSFSQRIITLVVKKYLVLNDYIRENLVQKHRQLRIASFYPVFFPAFHSSIKKKSNEIWVCVPGAVDFARRDYQSLSNAIASMTLPDNFRFVMAGRNNRSKEEFQSFYANIATRGLDKNFIFFDQFVSDEDFHGLIIESDFILPLIHPSKARYRSYATTKITGSFNLAFGYKKPLVMENFWKGYDDFQGVSAFYKVEELSKVIAEIASGKIEANALAAGYLTKEKFSFDFQAGAYIGLLKETV